MVVSASELLHATCEECIIFEKCLLCRFKDNNGLIRKQDPMELQTSPYSDGSGDHRKFWTDHFGGTVCPLFMPKKSNAHANLLDANLALKDIKKWCESQLKTGGTSKEDFDAQVVKFKALKELNISSLVVMLQPAFDEVQSLLMQVFGGIQNGNK